MSGGANGLRGHILISHTHWDHIQGIPFFAPLFAPGNEWDIYGPKGPGQSLREILAGQMQYTYSPITLDQCQAKIRYHDLVEGTFDIDDIKVSTHYLNHPALTLGYRLEADGVAVVYACDHEPYCAARQPATGKSLAKICDTPNSSVAPTFSSTTRNTLPKSIRPRSAGGIAQSNT